MAYKLEVGIPDPDQGGRITVMHTFYAKTEAGCYKLRDAHADICPRFGPAVKSDDVTEDLEEIAEDEWPTAGDDYEPDGEDEEEEEEE